MPGDSAVAAREMARLAISATSWDDHWWQASGHEITPADVIAALGPHLSTDRKQRIEQVLDRRTYRLAVVVDGMVDTGNVAAVMRSVEAFGVQAFHVVDTAGRYKHSRRTTQGAEKWLDRWRWQSPGDCVRFLRAAGYTVAVTRAGGEPIDRFGFTDPTALVFGNELDGVSAEMADAADVVLGIPMMGFAQSLNISVAVGICLADARPRLAGALSAEERDRLRAVWYQQSVPNPGPLLARFRGSP